MADKKFSLYTSEDLKEMQAWSLQRKIQVTQTRILEWYDKFDGQVYVSFSGGKDSTVLLDLARRVYPDIEAVFVDTGLEYPELREFVKTIDNVTWLKPEMNFKKVIQTYGYPLISKETSHKIYYARKAKESGNEKQYDHYVKGSRTNPRTGEMYSFMPLTKFGNKILDSDIPISNRCCDVMKKSPVKKFEHKTHKKPIVGTMACESRWRKDAWLKNGCNAFDSKRPISQPMSFWTEQDVFEYIVRFINLPYKKAWDEAQYAHGRVRRKARKFLRKYHYAKMGIASVYGEIKQDDNGKYYTTGCDRTGCVFCGFGCHLEKEPNRFERLKQTHPKLWDYCMRPMNEGGLGMREVLEYIDVKVE